MPCGILRCLCSPTDGSIETTACIPVRQAVESGVNATPIDTNAHDCAHRSGRTIGLPGIREQGQLPVLVRFAVQPELQPRRSECAKTLTTIRLLCLGKVILVFVHVVEQVVPRVRLPLLRAVRRVFHHRTERAVEALDQLPTFHDGAADPVDRLIGLRVKNVIAAIVGRAIATVELEPTAAPFLIDTPRRRIRSVSDLLKPLDQFPEATPEFGQRNGVSSCSGFTLQRIQPALGNENSTSNGWSDIS